MSCFTDGAVKQGNARGNTFVIPAKAGMTIRVVTKSGVFVITRGEFLFKVAAVAGH